MQKLRFLLEADGSNLHVPDLTMGMISYSHKTPTGEGESHLILSTGKENCASCMYSFTNSLISTYINSKMNSAFS